MPEKLLLGCVADDFTGGSDAASHLAAGGLNTILCNGVPAPGFVPPEGCEAVVIALKSRTQETESAVADSMKAARWLAEQGAEQLYVKYCSTFDSRPCGNIGPIVDAILEAFNVPGTVLCPALPSNGRVVRDGILYVNGVPLAESPMKDHPLTPMWESRVAKLMEPQGKYACLEVFRDALHGDPETLLTGLARRISSQAHYYIVPDYVDEADAEKIISLFGGMPGPYRRLRTFDAAGAAAEAAEARRGLLLCRSRAGPYFVRKLFPGDKRPDTMVFTSRRGGLTAPRQRSAERQRDRGDSVGAGRGIFLRSADLCI